MTMPRRVGPWQWTVVLLAQLAVSCSDAGQTRPGASTPERWTTGSAPLVTIGEVEGEAPYLFSRIAAVRLLPDGRIAVADGGSGTIRVFGPDGTVQRVMGGQGEGPGEFVHLAALPVATADTVAAYDARAQRLTSFLVGSGEVVSMVRLFARDGHPELYLGGTSGGGHVAAWIRQVGRDESGVTPDVMRIARFGPDGRLAVEELGRMAGMRRLRSPLPFSPHFLATMIGDSVFLTDGLDGTIRVMRASTGKRIRTLEVDMERWDPEEAWPELEEALGDPDRVDELRRVRGVPGTDSIPVFSEMLRDGRGRLWLKRYDPAVDSHWVFRKRTGGEWVVVETDGRVVARATVPDGFRLMEIRGRRVAGVRTDALGVERVQVYALQKGRE